MKTLNSSKKIIMGGLFVALLGVCNSAQAGYPKGYYDSLNGKCGVELKKAVKAIAINHSEIAYGNATWNAFLKTDVKVVNGVEYWWDMYSDNLVEVSSGHPGLNIEHSVANSWWGGTKNAAYKDLAHLNPSDVTANSRKSNYPLSEVGSTNWTNGVTTVGSPKSGQGGGASQVFEPADEYKGDFARAFMYMFTVYDDISWKTSGTTWMYDLSSDLTLRPWAQTLLLKWNTNDPVSIKEEDRNEGIKQTQGNRNPFIDLPALADHIWGSKKNVPFSVEEGGGSGESVSYTWLAEGDETEGDWTFEDVSLAEGLSYVWSWKVYNGKGYLNASAYMGGALEAESYAWSPEVSFNAVTRATFRFEHAAKFQTTCKELCKVAVYDVDSKQVTLIDIPKWPASGAWTFGDSGSIDLSRFKGKRVKIGFKYGSTTAGADTWEIRNAELNLVTDPAGVQGVESEADDSNFVDVWDGVIYAPAGARIFDMNGREYAAGTKLQHGVYIVAKPSFKKSVKVLVK